MLELADTVRFDEAVSASPIVKGIPETDVLTAMTRFVIAEMVGVSLTSFTVTEKDRETVLLLLPPSLTVTVMAATPNAPATGVNVSDPVAPGLV